jgi:hypothetical protein
VWAPGRRLLPSRTSRTIGGAASVATQTREENSIPWWRSSVARESPSPSSPVTAQTFSVDRKIAKIGLGSAYIRRGDAMQIGNRASERSVAQAASVLVLSILAYMSAVGFSVPTRAQEGCAWFGTKPFCDGQCPSDFVYTGRRESCTTGSRRYCCPSRYVRSGINCKWVGNPGSMLFVCDDPEFVPWAAVAIDGSGRWGASIRRPSVNSANTATRAGADALRRCGAGCRIVTSGAGRCVAVAQSKSGGYWVGFAHGDDREAVQNIAMQGCTDRAPPESCRLEHLNCL